MASVYITQVLVGYIDEPDHRSRALSVLSGLFREAVQRKIAWDEEVRNAAWKRADQYMDQVERNQCMVQLLNPTPEFRAAMRDACRLIFQTPFEQLALESQFWPNRVIFRESRSGNYIVNTFDTNGCLVRLISINIHERFPNLCRNHHGRLFFAENRVEDSIVHEWGHAWVVARNPQWRFICSSIPGAYPQAEEEAVITGHSLAGACPWSENRWRRWWNRPPRISHMGSVFPLRSFPYLFHEGGHTPVSEAVVCGADGDLVRMIKWGVNVDAPCDRAGLSPLHLAALHGQIRIIQLLVDSKANPNVRTREGRTPLHYCQNVAISFRLINLGAIPHVMDDYGVTPFDQPPLSAYRCTYRTPSPVVVQGYP